MKNIVKQNPFFKNPVRPTCIDLILTNSSRNFHDTCTMETGLLDFHKLIVTVVTLYFTIQKPNTQTFRNYKRFQKDLFRSEFDYELSKFDKCNLKLEHFWPLLCETIFSVVSFRNIVMRMRVILFIIFGIISYWLQ